MKPNKKSEEKSPKKAPVRSAPKIAATAPQTRTTRTTKAKAAAPAPVSAPSTSAVTTVQASVDVGFGNSLFIRGQGAGLSWDTGVQMENTGSSVWTWQAPAEGPVIFKVLINDQVWANGGDITANPGETVQVNPRF